MNGSTLVASRNYNGLNTSPLVSPPQTVQKDIPLSIENLEQSIYNLKERQLHLFTMLSAILRQEPCNPETKQEIPSRSTSMATKLAILTQSIDHMNSAVENVIQLLEL